MILAFLTLSASIKCRLAQIAEGDLNIGGKGKTKQQSGKK
jgi:hypothetical protein